MRGTVTHHSQSGGHYPVVLTTCQVHNVSADGSTTKARALLNFASSTSFITKSLAKRLHLRRRCHSMKVGGISGSATQLSSCGMVDLYILNGRSKTMAVAAVVLPQVTTDLPSHSVRFNHKWKHLLNIHQAYPDFGTPGVLICSLESMFSAIRCFTAGGLAVRVHHQLSKHVSVECLLVTPTSIVTAID